MRGVDLYVNLYSKIPHLEFEINKCYWLGEDSVKAIKKLGYDCCPHLENHVWTQDTALRECEICKENIGFMCCAEYTGYQMRACDGCGLLMCAEKCINHCGYCSDPAGYKKYYCINCSINCAACGDVVCDYCGDEVMYCDVCEKPFGKYCLDKHRMDDHNLEIESQGY